LESKALEILHEHPKQLDRRSISQARPPLRMHLRLPKPSRKSSLSRSLRLGLPGSGRLMIRAEGWLGIPPSGMTDATCRTTSITPSRKLLSQLLIWRWTRRTGCPRNHGARQRPISRTPTPHQHGGRCWTLNPQPLSSFCPGIPRRRRHSSCGLDTTEPPRVLKWRCSPPR
jgi:hypothetical protein